MAANDIQQNLVQIEAKLRVLENEREALEKRRHELTSQCQQLLGAKEAFVVALRIVREHAAQQPAPAKPAFAFDVETQPAAPPPPAEAKDAAPKPTTRGRKKKQVTIAEPESTAA